MKIVYIKTCYDCPYCRYDENYEEHVCLIRWNDQDMSVEESIVTEEMLTAKEPPEVCPLDDSC